MEKSVLHSRPAAIRDKLSFRGLFLHAWDLADDGADQVMGWMSEAGLNTLCLAGTYHSGWFIHPHNRRHRLFMTEGSVCYFRPQLSLYKRTKLRPRVSRLCHKKDWFAEAGRRLARHNLQLVSWTVGTHNTRLGLAHPELTQQNVYGDRIPHALCPAQPDVQNYLTALCWDLAANYPLWGIQLECFGWLGFRHGHHHERDLTGLSDLEADLMAMCVCPACTREAQREGVDMVGVKARVKATLDGAFREAPDRPKGHPRSMNELEHRCPDLKRFNRWRKGFADSVIAAIRQESLAGTDCRLLLQSEFDPALASVVDGFACVAYEKTPADTLRICRAAKRAADQNWKGLLQCFIQLGRGTPESEKQLRGIIQGVQNGGCNGINFYNRSEAPPKMLTWLAAVMKEFVE